MFSLPVAKSYLNKPKHFYVTVVIFLILFFYIHRSFSSRIQPRQRCPRHRQRHLRRDAKRDVLSTRGTRAQPHGGTVRSVPRVLFKEPRSVGETPNRTCGGRQRLVVAESESVARVGQSLCDDYVGLETGKLR